MCLSRNHRIRSPREILATRVFKVADKLGKCSHSGRIVAGRVTEYSDSGEGWELHELLCVDDKLGIMVLGCTRLVSDVHGILDRTIRSLERCT